MAPSKRSIVWEYFDRVDKESVLCNVCKKKLKCVNNTSNMRLHLKSMHPILLVRSEEGRQDNPDTELLPDSSTAGTGNSSSSATTAGMSSSSSSSSATAAGTSSSSSATAAGTSSHTSQPNKRPHPYFSANKKRCKQLKLTTKNVEFTEKEKRAVDRALVKMIGKDLQPLSIVENEGFRDYTEQLQPLYKLPSRKTLTNILVPEVCREISENIKSMLNQTDSVGITTDIWSSDSNTSFISVTCHFISDTSELQNVVLDTKEIPGSHTAELIAAYVQEVIDDWNISDKITAIITDNGSNIKKAVNVILKKTHIPCVGHTLNLCVQDAIEANELLQLSLKKCKKIVSHFKQSNLAADKLKEVQIQMKLPALKVKQDVSTRWNSSYFMIERLLAIREPLSVALTYLRNAPEPLDASEWIYLQECVEILEPLHTMTEEMSGQKYPTLSMVIPLLRSVQHALKSVKTNTDVSLLLKNQLIEVISRRFSGWEENKIVAKSTFLDPRFMKTSFGLPVNADKAEKYVTEELESMKKKLQNNNTATGGSSNATASSTPSAESALSKKDLARQKLWKWVDDKVEEKRKTINSSVQASSSIVVRHYLELPPPDRWKSPLPFCEEHKAVLPDLYKLQKKYLCLPATSVPSERLFSIAGLATNDRRNRLDPKNLNNILLLHSNMK
uniref:Zinc finger BED domain-containing protein 1-like n=1 Tax=Diabrotica virgifera virgifera TaxID=50390 RepID=A0A6P7H2S3_DIAVI